MASVALNGLLLGLEEARDLQRANPTPLGGISARPRVTRAINRACVVMLSSHLEKYVHSINEEAVALVNASGVPSERVPIQMRLQHAQPRIDDLGKTQWNNRGPQLESFSANEAWMWSAGLCGLIDHARLLVWMKTPKTKQLVRYYKLWGIEDIFADITRTPITKHRLLLKLDELVEKRNNIAHGDIHADATPKDLTEYILTVKNVCERADRRLARALRKDLGVSCPWY